MRSCYCLILTFLFLSACGVPEKTLKRSKVMMGTVWDISIVSKNEKTAEKAVAEISAEVVRLEKIFSLRDPLSELNQLNAQSGNGPVKVSSDLMAVLKTAIYVSELSEGAFDVSIGPVVKLWGFAGGSERVPSPSEIKLAHSLVGFKMIKLEPEKNMVTLLKKGMILDLGGIAKGYALDSVRPVLKKYNLANVMISAGGQVFVTGHNPEGKDWKIGIAHPKKSEELLGLLETTGKSISTSGNYERYFISKGRLYHHIFNPSDAYPASDTISATLILDISGFDQPNALADGLSTAIFVAGYKKGLQLCEKVTHSGTVIVTSAEGGMKVKISDNLKGKVIIKEQ